MSKQIGVGVKIIQIIQRKGMILGLGSDGDMYIYLNGMWYQEDGHVRDLYD